MTQRRETEYDGDLLDLHLGRLSAEQRAALEARLGADERLATEHEALAAVFSALDRIKNAPAPPADLTQRIAARVAAAAAAPRLVHPETEVLAEAQNTRIIRLRGFRDVIAVAAMIVLAIGVGVPGILHMKERNNRMLCARNLAAIGQGMHQYAAVFGDSLPFVGWNKASDSWRPSRGQGLRLLPNRRHVYPLIRTRNAPTSVFICPSSGDVPMPAEKAELQDDFLESRNVSYAYQNMSGIRPHVSGSAPGMPILSDDNPLFESGRPLFDMAAAHLGLSDLSQKNSAAHGGAGQNVLTLDGAVKFMASPSAGVNGDNIWTLQRVSKYTGREGPESATDSHLLK